MALEVANAILAMLGGNRFRAMTGAKGFTGDERALWFSLPATMTKDRINKVGIVLEATDTYTMKFFACRGSKAKLVAEVEGVYADMLRPIFEGRTGLVTSLGTMMGGV